MDKVTEFILISHQFFISIQGFYYFCPKPDVSYSND